MSALGLNDCSIGKRREIIKNLWDIYKSTSTKYQFVGAALSRNPTMDWEEASLVWESFNVAESLGQGCE